MAAQHLAGAPVATISKPRSASRLIGKIMPRLSRLATETKILPLVGSEPYAAAWDLAKACPKAMSMPMTSPVDFISGPSRVSTPLPAGVRNRLNGSTASLTATGASSRQQAAVAGGQQHPLGAQLWLALGLLLWMTSLPLSAPPSLTHDWVVRLSLAVSDRTVPYSRWRMHRDHRLLKLRRALDTAGWAPPSSARAQGQVN